MTDREHLKRMVENMADEPPARFTEEKPAPGGVELPGEQDVPDDQVLEGEDADEDPTVDNQEKPDDA